MTRARHALIRLIVVASVWLAGCGSPSPQPAPTLGVGPSASPTGIVVQPSGDPFQLSAQSLDTVIRLTWQSVSGASSYFVYRDGNERPLFPRPISDTTFDDIGLTNGRAYTYTVAAVDASGQIALTSESIRATPRSK